MRAIFSKCLAGLRCSAGLGVLALALSAPVAAEPEDEAAPGEELITIEELLKAGWEIAGYTSTVDNRSTFILFRNPGQSSLVQCRAGYDVTREPRVHTHCYRLK